MAEEKHYDSPIGRIKVVLPTQYARPVLLKLLDERLVAGSIYRAPIRQTPVAAGAVAGTEPQVVQTLAFMNRHEIMIRMAEHPTDRIDLDMVTRWELISMVVNRVRTMCPSAICAYRHVMATGAFAEDIRSRVRQDVGKIVHMSITDD